MMYFANPTGKAIDYMRSGVLGYIDTPLQGNKRPDNIVWCADNGCYNEKKFDETRWWEWLQNNNHDAPNCRFATAPDVVGDHHATLKRSAPWLPEIRTLGYPAAFVAQDGAQIHTIPWATFDVLFIGGTTEFKLGEVAVSLVKHAKELGMWVHIGRVNSLKRLRWAEAIGADSVDGTMLVFNPTDRLAELLGWVHNLKTQRPLFSAEVS